MLRQFAGISFVYLLFQILKIAMIGNMSKEIAINETISQVVKLSEVIDLLAVLTML